ncbi:MAG: leucine-rich repeat domain-containing protein [Anaeroplasmataceae bacterium]|nr:leucine-rich repeat domain-containing protein [Anaeroplasmataceae bacterium]
MNNSEKEGYAEHDFTDGDCVCGKKDPSIPTEGLEYTLNDDGESYSVKGIGTATDTDIVIASEYNGKSVTSIQSYAFSRCSGLTSITIPDSVTSIEQGAFENCSGLTSITIPDNVTSIGNFAFWGCSSLTSITIPDSITSIGDRAFYNCSSLQYNEFDNAYYFGNSTNPYLALITAKDTAITSCTIHKNTKFIVGPVFAKCSSLTSITIPDGVTGISNYMFQDCSGLTSIVIPNSITSIGQSAFYNCKGLTSITFNGTKAQWNDIEKDYFWNSGTGNYIVHCTDGDIAKDN